MKKIGGLELAVRFAVTAECCTSPSGQAALNEFLADPTHSNMKQVKDALDELPALPHFLRCIASVNGAAPYDERVVEAYVFGNDALKPVSAPAFKQHVLEPFVRQGIPAGHVEMYRRALGAARTFLPVNHTFDALLNIDRERHDRKLDLRVVNDVSMRCQVSFGRVLRVGDGMLAVAENRYRATHAGYDTESVSSTVSFEQRMLRVFPGVHVAIHHGKAFHVLHKIQGYSLVAYNRVAADAVNASLRAPAGRS